MGRVVPHLVAIGSALLCVWGASAVREAGARASARALSISWGHFVAALGLWAVAGVLLALPSLAAAVAAGRKLRLDWAVLVPYLVPGLLLALTLTFYMVARLPWLPIGWIPSFVRYGGDMFGSLLVGYGIVQSFTGGGTVADGKGHN